MTTPISVTATEATQHTSAPSHRKSPHHAPVSPKQRSRLSPGLTEREIYARKQTQQETTFKRKHEENDSTGIPKKFKSQQSSKNMTDGHKEMLLQLEEARLKDKKDLPCEWPRVAEGNLSWRTANRKYGIVVSVTNRSLSVVCFKCTVAQRIQKDLTSVAIVLRSLHTPMSCVRMLSFTQGKSHLNADSVRAPLQEPRL